MEYAAVSSGLESRRFCALVLDEQSVEKLLLASEVLQFPMGYKNL